MANKNKASAELNKYRSAAGKKGKDKGEGEVSKCGKEEKVPREVRARAEAVRKAWAISCFTRGCP